MNTASSKRPTVWRLALFGVLLIAIFVVVKSLNSPSTAHQTEPVTTSQNTNLPSLTATNAPTTPRVAASPITNRADFQLRPFPVANESTAHQWTSEDGKDTNVIQRLAHNDLEYQRMVEENNRIKRRQLVYRKDTAAALLQRSRLSGESVTQLTLPGFDGQEYQINIDRADLEASKQSGTFTGRLADKPNSIVTVAFKFGREAFTVMSPEDGTYLQGHPREPGEIIITSFDPDTYSPLPGGEPIRTSQK
ncbi:MAG: hypothetical protein AAB370_01685 [Verrucomicrobiota bacterium]